MIEISKEKVILTDVDGVRLHWLHAFDYWMIRHGFTKIHPDKYYIHDKYGIKMQKALEMCSFFNESAAIGSLSPMRDAIKYVKKLHEEHGYVFHCITAIPNDPYVKELRRDNLCKLFGETSIERLECVGNDSKNKYPILSEYKETGLIWIEDHYENAKMGSDLGLVTYLMDQDYNQNCVHPDIIRVNNWEEIYNAII